MIQYYVDEANEHLEDLLFHLRAHNSLFVDAIKEFKYAYAIEDNELIGFSKVKLNWDWVDLKDIYYKDIETLKAIVYKVYSEYKNKAIGLKLYATKEKRINDLIEVGFKIDGSTPGTTKEGDTYYLYLDNEFKGYNLTRNIELVEEEKKEYIDFIEGYQFLYKKQNNIELLTKEVLYIAKENDTFCGGIAFEIYENSMYIHLLATNKDYKGKGIGTKLMNFAIDYAKKLDLEYIDIGTAQFQARPFYEKLGFTVTYTKKNYPKGYEVYTLIKRLKE